MRVTRDARRCLLIDFLCWCECCCDRNVVWRGYDTTAIIIIVLVLAVVIIPAGVVITLIDGNIDIISREELVERNLLGKLMHQVNEDILCDKSEISDEL